MLFAIFLSVSFGERRPTTYIPAAAPTETPRLGLAPLPTFTAAPPGVTAGASPTYYVSSLGSDSNPGSRAQPWQTIRKAEKMALADSTVAVLAGDYPELIVIDKSNMRFIAQGKVSMKGFVVSGDNNLVSGFTITNPSSNFGIRVTGNDNIIENNDISNTGQDGIWFSGSGNTFTGNYIHDIVDRSKINFDPHVDCFQTWGPAENIVFEKNICNHTSTYGSNQILMLENNDPPVRNIIFRNNVFIMHDPGYSPLNFARKDGQQEITGMYVINNDIVHMGSIGYEGMRLINITDAHVINNLFIDYGDAEYSYILVEEGADIDISNNAVYKSDGILPKGGILPNDLWLRDIGLVDYRDYNFHLQPTSPLIDRGLAISVVNDDFDGHPRPSGTGYDIGAFEYGVAP